MLQQTLLRLFSEKNEKELTIDKHTGKIVEMTKQLVSASNFYPTISHHQNPIIRFIPQQDSINPLNIIYQNEVLSNSDKTSFLTEKAFSTGKITFEMTYFNDQKPKISLLNNINKNQQIDIPIEHVISDQIQFEIDFDEGLIQVKASNNIEDKIIFNKGEYLLKIEVFQNGNQVKINPFLQLDLITSVWKLNLSTVYDDLLQILSNHVIIKNPPKDLINSVEKFQKWKITLDQNEFNIDVYFDSNFLAFKKNDLNISHLKEQNNCYQYIEMNEIEQLVKNEDFDFHSFINEKLLKKEDFQLDKFLSDLNIENNIQKITKQKSTDEYKLSYLKKTNRLIVFNDLNGFKLLAEKNQNGEFIISPYLFPEENKCTFYLLKEEHHLMKSILKKLPLYLFQNNNHFSSTHITDFFKLVQISEDEQNYYYYGDFQVVGKFIQAYFYLLHFFIIGQFKKSSSEGFKIAKSKKLKIKQISVQESSDPNVNQPNKENQDQSDQSNTECFGIQWLFNEENSNETESEKENKYTHIELPNCLQISYDYVLKTIYKIEEALYLQDKKYRNEMSMIQRNHSTFSRLYSFLSLSFPSAIPIETLLDFGLMINSQFVDQFQYFMNKDFPTEDYSIHVSSKKQNKGNLHQYNDKVNFSLSTSYSINCLVPFTVNSQIPFHQVLNEKYLFYIDGNFKAHLLSTKYGLIPIWEQDLLLGNLEKCRNVFSDILDYKKQKNSQQNDLEENEIDQTKLDFLYEMGFPLSLCKIALKQCKQETYDNLINFMLEQQEKMNQEKKQELGTKVNLIIKPEWRCQFCTYINETCKMTTKDVCTMCLNKADVTCYIELDDEIKEDEKQQEQKTIQYDKIEKTDEFKEVYFVEFDKQNLLNSYFLGLKIQRQDQTFIFWYQLSINAELIQKLVLINYYNMTCSCVFGKQMLQQDMIEFQLMEKLDEFKEQFFNILPVFYKYPLFKCHQVKKYSIDKDMILHLGNKAVQERNKATLNIISQQNKYYQKCSLEIETSSYEDIIYSFKIYENQTNTINENVLFLNNHLYVQKPNCIQILNQNFEDIGKIDVEGMGQRLILFDSNLYHQKNDGSVGKIQLKPSSKQQLQNLIQTYKNNRSSYDSNQKDLSPKHILQSFKTYNQVAFILLNKTNTLINKNNMEYQWNNNFIISNEHQSSQIDISLKKNKEVVSLQMFLKLQIDPSSDLINEIVQFKQQNQVEEKTSNRNLWLDIQLKCFSNNSYSFSKNEFLSNLLSKDDIYYTFKKDHSLMIFENFESKHMKIFSIKLKVQSNSKKDMNKFLVVVFNDINEANEINQLKEEDFDSEGKIKNLRYLSALQSQFIDINGLQSNAEDIYNIEIEKGFVGKYIGLLPLNYSKQVNSLQYFGVVGECIEQIQETSIQEKFDQKLQNLQTIKIEGISVFNQEEKVDISNFKVLYYETGDQFYVVLYNQTQFQNLTNQTLSLHMAPCSKYQFVSGKLQLVGLSKELNQIRKDFQKKNLTNLQKTLSLFSNQLVETNCTEQYYQEILELFIFLLNEYQENVMQIYLKEISFRQFFINILQSTGKNTQKLSIIFLVELFKYKESEHIKVILGEIIDDLTSFKISPSGILTFWKILFLIFQKNEMDGKLRNKILNLIMKISEKCHSLYSPIEKFLDVAGFTNVNCSSFDYFNNLTEKQIQNSITSNSTKSDSKNLPYNMLSKREQNQQTFYIQTQSLSSIFEIQGTLKEPQINYMKVYIYAYCMEEEKFVPLVKKYFDENYFNQLKLNPQLQDSFFIDIKNEFPYMIFKMVFLLSSIPNFEQQVSKNMEISFQIKGELFTHNQQETQSFIDEIKKKNIQKFFDLQKSMENTVVCVNQLKNLPEETQQNNDTENTVIISKIDIEQILQQTQICRSNLIYLMESIKPNQFSNLGSFKDEIQEIIKMYQSNQATLIQNYEQLSIQNLDLENNFSFWQTQLDFLIEQLNDQKDLQSIIFSNMENKEEFFFKLVYQKQFFTNQPSVSQFLFQFSQVFIKEIKKDTLIENICANFIKESNLIFFNQLEDFCNKMIFSPFYEERFLKSIITCIESENPHEEQNMKKIIFLCYVLNKSSFFSAKEVNIYKDNFQDFIIICYWIISGKLQEFHPIFISTFNNLFYLILQISLLKKNEKFDLGFEITDLIMLCYENNNLESINNIFNKFMMTFVKNSDSKLNENLLKLKKQFYNLIQENIIQEEYSKEKQKLLVFCLKYLKLFEQFENKDQKEEEIKKKEIKREASIIRTQSQIAKTSYFSRGDEQTNSFILEMIQYLSKNNVNDQTVIKVLVDYVINKNLNKTIFFAFLDYFMRREETIRKGQVMRIQKKFEDFLKKLEMKKNQEELMKDISSLMIDGVAYLMQNHLKVLEQEFEVLNLCHFFLLYIINKFQNITIKNSCSHPIRMNVYGSLFQITMQVLNENFNLGGLQNFESFDGMKIPLLELISLCVFILNFAIDENRNLIIKNYFINNFNSCKQIFGESFMEKAIENMCVWLLIHYNHTNETMSSPCQQHLQRIYQNILIIFNTLFDNDDIAILCMSILNKQLKILHEQLLSKLKQKKIGYHAIEMIKTAVAFYSFVIEKIVKNGNVSKAYLQEQQGLELIFNILNQTSQTKENKQSKFLELLSSVQSKKPENQTESQDNMKLQEFANDLNWVSLDNALSKITGKKQWSQNKAGKVGQLYTTTFQYHKKQIMFGFSLDKPIELKNFRIGLIVSKVENYMVVGEPYFIQIYAIQKINEERTEVYLGEMELVKDNSYLNFLVMVYEMNPNKFNGKSFQQSIDNLKYLDNITEFKLVIGQPIITMIDKVSPMQNKTYQALNFAINFISVNGYPLDNVDFTKIYQQIVKVKFFDFIDKIFNSEKSIELIGEYFDSLKQRNETDLFNMIQVQLDNIRDLFNIKLSRFLLIISEKNEKMSRIVFTFLLNNLDKHPIFYNLIENILKKTMNIEFFDEFLDKGKKNLILSKDFGSSFLGVICNFLTFIDKHYQSSFKFLLKIDLDFYKTLIQKFQNHHFDYNFERIIVLILFYIQKGNLLITPDFEEQCKSIEQMTEKYKDIESQQKDAFFQALISKIFIDNDLNYLCFLTSCALKLDNVKQLLVNPKNVFIFQNCKIYLRETELTKQFKVLMFLSQCSDFPEIHKILLENQIENDLLFCLERMINYDNKEIIKLEKACLIQTIYNVYLKKDQGVDELEKQVFELLKKNTKNQYFINEIFLKFFQLENFKNIQFKENTDLGIVSIKDLERTQKKVEMSLQLDTSIFPKEMQKILYDNLPQLCDDKTIQKIGDFNWQKVYSNNGQQKELPQLLKTLSENKPFMIILDCKNSNKNSVLGIFSDLGFQLKAKSTTEAFVPLSDNLFLFYYTQEDNQHCHYKCVSAFQEQFLEFSLTPDNETITFSYENQEKIFLSLLDDSHTVDLYPMKPLENKEDFPYDVHLNGFEIFQLQVQVNEPSFETGDSFYEKLKENLLEGGLLNPTQSFFQYNPVFTLFENLNIQQIEKTLNIKIMMEEENKNSKLSTFKGDIVTLHYSGDLPMIKRELFAEKYTPYYPLFEKFVEQGGMKFIIQDILKRDSELLNQTEKMKEALQNILDLQEIEGLLSNMIQKKEFLNVIIELFCEQVSEKTNLAESEIMISQLIFFKLNQILQNNSSFETKMKLFQKEVLQKLLKKLQGLTSEIFRVYKDEDEEEKIENVEIQVEEPKEEDYIKKVQKRKGVGYDREGSGKKWMINEYLQQKEAKNEFILQLLKLFNTLMDIDFNEHPDQWQIRDSFYNTICESCLLPLLESSFKSSSLHEMAKEQSLYEEYCKLILILAKHNHLRELLKKIPSTYKPVQIESILQILNTQEENTKLFYSFNHEVTPESDEYKSIKLAEDILKTIEQIKNYYPEFFKKNNETEGLMSTEEVKKLMELPLNEQYKRSLSDFRFGLCEMTISKHHYNSSINSESKTSNQGRMVRLAQEMTSLSSSLPNDSYNAIFVRSYVKRLDVMKALISGAEGTPYANGLFEYDVYLSNEYPQSPPKCNLETTGGGDVRFNPNLYSCGKVCLSLLGTWRGNASENWDPNISNLLQLFMSIQAVVMSEEVYFNEPGYEGEAGTEEGEKKNEGYSNIVRLCNIKYAMIGQIKNPSEGFEEVVRRHFYLKRDVIMKEVSKWIKYAEVRPCYYGGLVSDHNYKYCQKYNSDGKKFIVELKEAVEQLEQTLKGLVDSFEIERLFLPQKHLQKYEKQIKEKANKELMQEKKYEGKIDTTYDDKIQQKEFDIDDQKVTDRWSRYIGAMGIDAVKKQTKAKIMIFGINTLGLEIAKNIVLCGVNKLTLYDDQLLQKKDLLGNFYVNESNLGKPRSEVATSKLQQLNYYVKVESKHLENEATEQDVQDHDIVVICDHFGKGKKLRELASKLNKKIIIAETVGVYIRIFGDFGKDFEVLDRDGEEPAECFIKAVDLEQNLIELFPNSVHDIRTNDHVTLTEIICEEDENGVDLNGSIWEVVDFQKKHILQVKQVEDKKEYKSYKLNGKLQQLKIPQKLTFKKYEDQKEDPLISDGFMMHDFEKLTNVEHLKTIFKIKEDLEEKQGKRFSEILWEDIEKEIKWPEGEDDKKALKERFQRFYLNQVGSVHSICAFIGGLVSQEIIKGITNKFTPIYQNFYSDFEEILDSKYFGETIIELFTSEIKNKPISQWIEFKTQYSGLEFLLGETTMLNIKNSKLFMVGAGAIGCELLKNYAMIGFGCGEQGKITLTDPDMIELSNLSRQFLFREKHIGKPKSIVASKVIEEMNADYKDKINARLEKMCDETEEFFNDQFFQQQTICLNALDNVKARIYMDQRCVRNLIPLLESGTLGPKGHVQVILPKITENYTSVRDANEENSIPICTLKMFPEEALHCMEWAKDRFDYYFSQKPRQLNRVLEDYKKGNSLESIDAKILKASISFLKKKPTTYKECIEKGRNVFQKYFHNNIKQLLHVYPLDHKTKEGKLFWSLPKRPPTPLDFDFKDKLHFESVISFARLFAEIWGITVEDFGYEEFLTTYQAPAFKPKDDEIKKIQKEVAQQENQEKQNEENEQEEQPTTMNTVEIIEEFKKKLNGLDLDEIMKNVHEIIFEKDDDQNGHVDVISALCNLRVRNYKLKEMDKIQVKLKAGKIVPALATTTAAISALQTIEAIKIVKGLPLKDYRNAFLNMAVPILTLSEPGIVIKNKLKEGLEVTVWDQWEYQIGQNEELSDLFSFIQNEKGLHPVDVFKGKKVVFFDAVNSLDDFKEEKLNSLLELSENEYCYLSVICKESKESEKVLENVPLIKVLFKEKQ